MADNIHVRPGDPVPKPEDKKTSSASEGEGKRHNIEATNLRQAENKALAGIKEFYRAFEQQKLPKDFDGNERPLRELYKHPSFVQKADGSFEKVEKEEAIDPIAAAIRNDILVEDDQKNQYGKLIDNLGDHEAFFEQTRNEQAALEKSKDYDLAMRGFAKDPQSAPEKDAKAGLPIIENKLKENFNAQITRLKGLHNKQIRTLVDHLSAQPDVEGQGIDEKAAQIINQFATDNNGIPGGKAQELLDKLKDAEVSKFAIDQTNALLVQQDNTRQLLLSSYNSQIQRINDAVKVRVAIKRAQLASNTAGRLSAQHTGLLNSFEPDSFRGIDPRNIDKDTITEGNNPDWYQNYQETRKQAFNTDKRHITAVEITSPSLLSGGKDGKYGDFIVSHDSGGLNFSLELIRGVSKAKKIEMWGEMLSKEAPFMDSFNLTKLKATLGKEGVEAIARRIIEVNPQIKLLPKDLAPDLTSHQGKQQLHAQWCHRNGIAYGNSPEIGKLALDPEDIFPHKQAEQAADEIQVKAPAADEIAVKPPNRMAAIAAKNIPAGGAPGGGAPAPDDEDDDPDVQFGLGGRPGGGP